MFFVLPKHVPQAIANLADGSVRADSIENQRHKVVITLGCLLEHVERLAAAGAEGWPDMPPVKIHKVYVGRTGGIYLSRPTEEIAKFLIPKIFVAQLVSLCFVFVLSILVTHTIAGPVYRMERIAREIGRGNLRGHTRLRPRDELKELADAFNMMSEGLAGKVRAMRNELTALEKAGSQADLSKLKALLDEFELPEDEERPGGADASLLDDEGPAEPDDDYFDELRDEEIIEDVDSGEEDEEGPGDHGASTGDAAAAADGSSSASEASGAADRSDEVADSGGSEGASEPRKETEPAWETEPSERAGSSASGARKRGLRNAGDLEGDYSFVVGRVGENRIYAIKNGSGMVVGIGDGFTCMGSDLPSVLPLTRNILRI